MKQGAEGAAPYKTAAFMSSRTSDGDFSTRLVLEWSKTEKTDARD
jgi:hypothetical protein